MVLTSSPRRALQSLLMHPATKPVLFTAALLPLALLIAGIARHTLGWTGTAATRQAGGFPRVVAST